MSVQKLIVSKESTGFTILSNHVLQNLSDPEALGIWAYLSSLPPSWEIYKETIRKHFSIGQKKIDKIFTNLRRLKLLRIEVVKDAQGKFVHFDLQVCNGNEFAQTQQEKKQVESTCTSTPPKTTGMETIPMEKRSYKETTNKTNTQTKQTKNLSASDDAHARALSDDSFEQFWNKYPVKKNKKRSKKIWEREKCWQMLRQIMDDVVKRGVHDHQWQQRQFIPHPSTYLQNEMWNDEIVKATQPTVTARSPFIRPTEAPRPAMRDFTQERLDREAQGTISH